jgi:predicted Zn-dependent protease
MTRSKQQKMGAQPSSDRDDAGADHGYEVFARPLIAAVLALSLGLQPMVSTAQTENLPRLGDAGGDELSPADERRLGESIMREIRRDASVSDDVEINAYLNQLVGSLSETAVAAGFIFEPFLVLDSTLNAFALPGGFIGVHSGLIVASQGESELASVLAHEIGHVTQRHIARMLSDRKLGSVGMMAALVLAALAARSSPQGAMGIATMAMGVQQQRMLSFSRDAEREADRVGLETLRQAGFDPNGMIAFFGRLQRASQAYEGQAPAYLSSHPLTGERIADMQTRVQDARYRQRPDSLEFRLVRAKLQAQAVTSVDGLGAARTRFEGLLRDKTTPDAAATWYGLAVVLLAQRDFDAAGRAINEARRRLPSGHPYLERLAAQIRLDAGDAAGALQIAAAGTQRFPGARTLVHLQADAMLRLRKFADAETFLQDQLATYRSDPVLWRLLARTYQSAGKQALAHRASAEEYALIGGWLASIEQFKLALQAGGLDFYTSSQIDARIKQVQAAYTREQQDRAQR